MPGTNSDATKAGIYRATFRGSMLAADPTEDNPGHVRALVSAYDVKYRIGWALWHTIQAGAFAKSIAEQPAIPLFWMHSWAWSERPPIGSAQAEESEADGGLVIDGGIYVNDSGDNMSLYRSLKDGAIREWSIGYDVITSTVDKEDELHEYVVEAELLEASAVLRGANPETETLQVASRNNGLTRVTVGEDVIVETADAALIAKLVGLTQEPNKDEETHEEMVEFLNAAALPWSAQKKIQEVYGDALVVGK